MSATAPMLVEARARLAAVAPGAFPAAERARIVAGGIKLGLGRDELREWAGDAVDDEAVERSLGDVSAGAFFATLKRAAAGDVSEPEFGEDAWPIPGDPFRELEAAPFSVDCVPPPIARAAIAWHEATGFDPSGAIVACTVAAAAAIDDRYRLAVRPASEHFESARLWAVLIGRPSDGKSPTIRVATDPIKDIHRALFGQWTEAGGDTSGEPRPGIFTSDATVEALADVLKNNPRGVLMLTEEFASWLGSIDAYRDAGAAKSRGEWLQLYDGGPHQIDRVKRGSFLVPNWSASVLAAGTPAGLRDSLRNVPDDGLIHRFIPCVMRMPIDPAGGDARDALRDWSALLVDVFDATTMSETRQRARISTQAAMLYEQEVRALRDAVIAVYDLSPALSAHLGKHAGLIARVALTFHVIDKRAGDAIETDTIKRAIRFMRTVRKHAAALFLSILSTAPALELARHMARAIAAEQISPAAIGRTWLSNHCRAFRAADDAEKRAALGLLCDMAWLRPAAESRGYGAWTVTEWAVNPQIAERFAAAGEQHRARREAVREVFGWGQP